MVVPFFVSFFGGIYLVNRTSHRPGSPCLNMPAPGTFFGGSSCLMGECPRIYRWWTSGDAWTFHASFGICSHSVFSARDLDKVKKRRAGAYRPKGESQVVAEKRMKQR